MGAMRCAPTFGAINSGLGLSVNAGGATVTPEGAGGVNPGVESARPRVVYMVFLSCAF